MADQKERDEPFDLVNEWAKWKGRDGCCADWPKPCQYHEGYADAMDAAADEKGRDEMKGTVMRKTPPALDHKNNPMHDADGKPCRVCGQNHWPTYEKDTAATRDKRVEEAGYELAMAVRDNWHPDAPPPAIAAAYETFMNVLHRDFEVPGAVKGSGW